MRVMEVKPPERKHIIDINIEADSEEELIAHLEHVLFTFKTSGISRSSVSGGYSTGHIITYRVNEDVTHESWAKALDEYLGRNDGTESTTIS